MDKELIEPNFNIDRDVFMVTNEGTSLEDGSGGLKTKANIILLSYNRPRMVREAIRSVLSQDYNNLELFLADDGSDFDVQGLLDEFKDGRLVLYQATKISNKERMERSRVAENINRIIDSIPSEELIYYLCDDDIMAPNWIPRSVAAIESAQEYHIVQGESFSFEDGQDWRTESISGMKLQFEDNMPRLWWATGSFCHKAYCWREENIQWHDNTYGHSQDANFITDMWNAHSQYLIIDKPAFYHREHPGMLSSRLGRKDEYGRYETGYVPPPISEDMIGWMEE
jgi:glycosyltransferase involved in cell wall biosynthesis